MLLAIDFENLHRILRSLYQDMMPLCSQMTGVAKGIAGLGALFYVAYRVWQSLSSTSPYFYLRQNDVIYVEPTDTRKYQSEYSVNDSYKIQVISTIVSGCSVVASLIIALAVK